MSKHNFIKVRDQFEGFHLYEAAPDEVAFLRYRHRHLFKIGMEIEVFDTDRELEFFMVKSNWQDKIKPFIALKDNLGSCEQIADRILEGLINSYGEQRYYCVTVSEDGESDGISEWLPNN